MGLTVGLLLHGIWMIWLGEIWPPRLLHWPSRTEAMHTAVFTMPLTGWDFDPIAAGLCGIILPIGCALCGGLSGRRFKHWLAEPKTWRIAALICGALSSANLFLLFYLLVIED